MSAGGSITAGGNVSAGSITSSGMNADSLNLTAGLSAGGNITADGEITAPRINMDPNFYQQIQEGDPVVGFDSWDWLQFERETNTYYFVSDGSSKLKIKPDEVESLVNLIAPNIMHKVVDQYFDADGTEYSVTIPGDQYPRFRVVAKFRYDVQSSNEPHLCLKFNNSTSSYNGISRQHWYNSSYTEYQYDCIPIARSGHTKDSDITIDFILDDPYAYPSVTGTISEAPYNSQHPGSTGTFGGTWRSNGPVNTLTFFLDAGGAQILDAQITVWAMP